MIAIFLLLVITLTQVQCYFAFSSSSPFLINSSHHRRQSCSCSCRGDGVTTSRSISGTSTTSATGRVTTNSIILSMGLFDGISKAFTNQDFKAKDERVRVSHILIKDNDEDDDPMGAYSKIKLLLDDIQSRCEIELSSSSESSSEENEKEIEARRMIFLPQVFSELAKKESQCPSASKGGDLGLFGKGTMAKEFDVALFPSSSSDTSPPPSVGTIVGPIVTDFGIHIILVTDRDTDTNQVEEKLARIDPDAIR